MRLAQGSSICLPALTQPQIDACERWLVDHPPSVVDSWLSGTEPCALPTLEDGLAARNGADPAADIVYILHTAREGEL